jgi:hypothetical protein
MPGKTKHGLFEEAVLSEPLVCLDVAQALPVFSVPAVSNRLMACAATSCISGRR